MTGYPEIAQATMEQLDTLGPLLRGYPYLAYRSLRDVTSTELADVAVATIEATLRSDDDNAAYVAMDGATPVGVSGLRLLPWDTQLFKKKMAMVSPLLATGSYDQQAAILGALLSRINGRCRHLKIEHLSIRIDASDVACRHALEADGFRLMDTLITYWFDFAATPMHSVDYPFPIREQTERDIEPIVDLARQSFVNYVDRFHSDPTLANTDCDELYARWARNSCYRLVADWVSVAEAEGEVVGFSTRKYHREVQAFLRRSFGEIVLTCVSSRARRGGVYTSLNHEGLRWFHGKVDIAQVMTQLENVAVQRAMTGLGFKPVGARHTFHKCF